MGKIVITANTSWYVYNFRSTLIAELRTMGHEVIVVAPLDEYSAKITRQQVEFVPVKLNRKGLNPLEDGIFILRMYLILRRIQPDVVLTYTPKINIYASLAARLCGTNVINNISGLGTAFSKNGLLAFFVRFLYRVSLKKSQRVFFQNNDDLSLFVGNYLVSQVVAERIPGSGVNIAAFMPAGQPHESGQFVFMLVARMLWDKGVGDVVAAMRMLKPRYPAISCHLVGFLDDGNPSAVSAATLQQWEEEGVVIYRGSTDQVSECMREADCIILPSRYREGVPRSLLEGASMGKPVITTDMPGCRDVVEHGVNGFLCRPCDPDDLAAKMETMIMLSKEDLAVMGHCSRQKMVAEFDERKIIDRYVAEINRLTGNEIRTCTVAL